MQDYIKKFDTFEDFFSWLESEEKDGKDGHSDELQMKQEFRRESVDATRRRVAGKDLKTRMKNMEKVDYKQRMQFVYEELHG